MGKRQAQMEEIPGLSEFAHWPYYSRTKREMLLAMARLYPYVRLVYLYKVRQPDGTLFRGGKEDSDTSSFLSLVGYKTLDPYKKEAYQMFEGTVVQQIGRKPLPEEIRVAFRPMIETFRSVFVDDVQEATGSHILVETSPGNWQAHFFLSREVNRDEAAKIQRYMIKQHNGDTAAASPVQARRFPEGRFIFEPWREPLYVDAILDEIEETVVEHKPKVITQSSNAANWTPEALEQLYTRLSKGRTNLSDCDQSFVLYLVAKGLDDEFISDALQAVSPDLERRHPSTQDYIRRTITKADQFI